ncbi:PAS domain S-box protein [Methanobacterium sp.]|uniref:PAS domain S-box protein n=1 Tax=Methanobacterium sp. TaxID=2164 RepID=UPI003C771E24
MDTDDIVKITDEENQQKSSGQIHFIRNLESSTDNTRTNKFLKTSEKNNWMNLMLRYIFAIIIALIAFWLYLILTHILGPGLPTYVIFYPAVIIVALIAGLGPGILATIISVMLAGIWILPPVGQFSISSTIDQVGAVLFTGFGILISGVSELYRRNRNKAAAYDKEKALRETIRDKEFLADILDQSSQPFAIAYPNGRLGLFNPAFEQLTGYTREELQNIDWPELTPIKWRRVDKQILEEVYNTGQPIRYEKEYIRKDGSRLPVELLMNIALDKEGNPAYYYSFFTDITNRKQSEDLLRESEEKYRNIIETANEGILMTDPSAIITFANSKMAEMLGYSIKELLGLDSLTLIDETEIERENQRIDDRKKGVKGEYELKFHKKNNEILWVHGSVSSIYNNEGKHIGNLTMYTDINDRKKSEEALNNSQKLLHDLINGFPYPIFVKDTEGRFLTTNNKFDELFGFKNEELKGKTDYDIVTKELAESYRISDQKVLEEEKSVRIEDERDLIDGPHTFIANKFPIYDIKGKTYGVGSISTDITERKLLEEQMKITMEELKRSNDELERFAYVSSHDLQEPLRMVTLYSQLLEKRYKESLDDDAEDFIEYIVEGAQRMRQLIEDLLEYSRVNSQAKEFEDVNTEEVLDSVLMNLSISIIEYNVTISHENLPTIFADKNQISQIFQNLIINAIKFHGQKPPKIDVSAKNNGKEWIFAVADNGIGIKSEHQKQIFEVFKRLHTRKEYPGTGIGLSIIQKIVHHHGGQIWVESEPGKGSTFYFTIPNKCN